MKCEVEVRNWIWKIRNFLAEKIWNWIYLKLMHLRIKKSGGKEKWSWSLKVKYKIKFLKLKKWWRHLKLMKLWWRNPEVMKVEVDDNWKWRNLKLKFEVKTIVADEILELKKLKLKKLKDVENQGWQNLKQKKRWTQ